MQIFTHTLSPVRLKLTLSPSDISTEGSTLGISPDHHDKKEKNNHFKKKLPEISTDGSTLGNSPVSAPILTPSKAF